MKRDGASVISLGKTSSLSKVKGKKPESKGRAVQFAKSKQKLTTLLCAKPSLPDF